MKKFLLTVLCFTLTMSMFACKGGEEKPGETESSSEKVSETETEAPKNTVVACVGDSITYGTGLAESGIDREKNCYPSQLAEKLGDTYTVVNCGLPSAGVYDNTNLTEAGNNYKNTSGNPFLPYIESQEYKTAVRSNPDIVVIMLGTNDSLHIKGGFIDGDAEAYFIEKYKELVDSFLNLDSEPSFVFVKPPVAISGYANYRKLNSNIKRYVNAAIESIYEEYNTAYPGRFVLADMYTASENLTESDYYPDGLHLITGGLTALANEVYNAIAK